MASFTITDLKKYLGPGLGLRKNKYLLEIPIPGIEGSKINVLARSAGLPERTITTTSMYHKGRQYNVRGETDYGGSYEVSIVDDSNMDIRRQFDVWLKLVDNSRPKTSGLFSGASYENSLSDALGIVKSGMKVASVVKDAIKSPMETLGNFVMGAIDGAVAVAAPKYQTDINIWQLDGNSSKVYGYKIQNAFPSQIGIVTLDDDNPNTLSEFSVTFTFSEFTPLDGSSIPLQLLNTLVGTSGRDVLNGAKALLK